MPDSADILDDLGIPKVINAAATLTALGGSVMPDEVVAAMVRASRSHVDMQQLHDVVGARIAALTRNEAAYVTSGCAAAIVLAVLACATGGDPAAISRMPGATDLPTQVVMHRAHRIPYDPAVELAGCTIVEIGNVIQTFDWELKAALTESTACVLWVAGDHLPAATLSLRETVEVAHARGVPVIVDAAAQLPPMSNLWRFSVDEGADLVLFSGGKALRGPQASGLMLGRRELIDAARQNGAPYQRLARALKVGKEEMLGLLAAVERYVGLDHDALLVDWEHTVADWSEKVNQLPGVSARRVVPNEAGQPTPRLRIDLDERQVGLSAEKLAARLWERSPRIAVIQALPHSVFITPDTLGPGEADAVISAVCEELGGAATPP